RTGLSEGVVAEMTSRDLIRINVGGWFNKTFPRLASVEYEQQLIPTLDQVFCFLRQHDQFEKKILYLELKAETQEAAHTNLPRLVVQLINDHGIRDRVIIVSFNLKAIAQVRQLDIVMRTGALFAPRRRFGMLTVRRLIAAAIESGASEILLH